MNPMGLLGLLLATALAAATASGGGGVLPAPAAPRELDETLLGDNDTTVLETTTTAVETTITTKADTTLEVTTTTLAETTLEVTTTTLADTTTKVAAETNTTADTTLVLTTTEGDTTLEVTTTTLAATTLADTTLVLTTTEADTTLVVTTTTLATTLADTTTKVAAGETTTEAADPNATLVVTTTLAGTTLAATTTTLATTLAGATTTLAATTTTLAATTPVVTTTTLATTKASTTTAPSPSPTTTTVGTTTITATTTTRTTTTTRAPSPTPSWSPTPSPSWSPTPSSSPSPSWGSSTPPPTGYEDAVLCNGPMDCSPGEQCFPFGMLPGEVMGQMGNMPPPAMGVCVFQAPDACNSDWECMPGSVCTDPMELMIPGLMEFLPPDKWGFCAADVVACVTNWDCSMGGICSTAGGQVQGMCPMGEQCFCADYLEDVQQCVTPGDCAPGDSCVSIMSSMPVPPDQFCSGACVCAAGSDVTVAACMGNMDCWESEQCVSTTTASVVPATGCEMWDTCVCAEFEEAAVTCQSQMDCMDSGDQCVSLSSKTPVPASGCAYADMCVCATAQEAAVTCMLQTDCMMPGDKCVSIISKNPVPAAGCPPGEDCYCAAPAFQVVTCLSNGDCSPGDMCMVVASQMPAPASGCLATDFCACAAMATTTTNTTTSTTVTITTTRVATTTNRPTTTLPTTTLPPTTVGPPTTTRPGDPTATQTTTTQTTTTLTTTTATSTTRTSSTSTVTSTTRTTTTTTTITMTTTTVTTSTRTSTTTTTQTQIVFPYTQPCASDDDCMADAMCVPIYQLGMLNAFLPRGTWGFCTTIIKTCTTQQECFNGEVCASASTQMVTGAAGCDSWDTCMCVGMPVQGSCFTPEECGAGDNFCVDISGQTVPPGLMCDAMSSCGCQIDGDVQVTACVDDTECMNSEYCYPVQRGEIDGVPLPPGKIGVCAVADLAIATCSIDTDCPNNGECIKLDPWVTSGGDLFYELDPATRGICTEVAWIQYCNTTMECAGCTDWATGAVLSPFDVCEHMCACVDYGPPTSTSTRTTTTGTTTTATGTTTTRTGTTTTVTTTTLTTRTTTVTTRTDTSTTVSTTTRTTTSTVTTSRTQTQTATVTTTSTVTTRTTTVTTRTVTTTTTQDPSFCVMPQNLAVGTDSSDCLGKKPTSTCLVVCSDDYDNPDVLPVRYTCTNALTGFVSATGGPNCYSTTFTSTTRTTTSRTTTSSTRTTTTRPTTTSTTRTFTTSTTSTRTSSTTTTTTTTTLALCPRVPSGTGIDNSDCGAKVAGMNCTLTCKGVYEGDPTGLVCGPDGEFIGNKPTCTKKQCRTGLPDSSLYDVSGCIGAEVGTTCPITCLPGYVYKKRFIGCGSSGAFSASANNLPTCVRMQCSKLPSGTGVNNTDCKGAKSGDNCTVTCKPGYSGDAVDLFCDNDGSFANWLSPDLPATATCQVKRCPLPDSLTDVSLDSSDCTGLRYGESCNVECADGYDGDFQTWQCSGDGPNLTGTVPTCSPQPCTRRLPESLYALVESDCVGKTSDQTCTATCIAGYERSSGSGAVTCRKTGAFSTSTLVCSRKRCVDITTVTGFPNPPVDTDCANKVYRQSCNAFCADGYDITGSPSKLKCSADTSFVNAADNTAATPPTCAAVPCDENTIPNARGITTDCSGKATGETCTATKTAGFDYAVGSGPKTITCQDTGSFEWDDVAVQVVPGSCPAPSWDGVAGVSSSCGSKKVGTKCWAYCQAGYDGTPVKYKCDVADDGSLTIVAATDGQAVSCEASLAPRRMQALAETRRLQATCAAAPAVTVGRKTNCAAGQADATTCIMECADGYQITGSSIVYTCDAAGTGTFTYSGSHQYPDCAPIACTYNLPSGTGVTSNCAGVGTDSGCTASCNTGYSGSSSSFSCSATGEFTGTNPTCTPLTCNNLTMDASFSTAACVGKTTGQSCLVSCGEGYTLSGSAATYTCGTDQTLTGTPPTCTANSCTGGVPSGADIDPEAGCSSLTTGQTCSVPCKTSSGYSGPAATYTCATTGTLTGTYPTCTLQVCSTPTMNASYSHTCTSKTMGTSCTVGCAAGYVYGTGSAALTWRCSWSDFDQAAVLSPVAGDYPTCIGVPCTDNIPTGDTIAHNCAGVRTGSTCTASCVPGYSGTAQTLTCQATGALSGSAPTCTLMTCSALTSTTEYNASACAAVHFGDVCPVACQAGYNGTATTKTCSLDSTNTSVLLVGSTPTCDAEECIYNLPVGTQFSHNCSGRVTGETCTVSCATGWAGTPATFSCGADNSLVGDMPTCLWVTTTRTSTTKTETTTTQTTTVTVTQTETTTTETSTTITETTTSITETTTSVTTTTRTQTTTLTSTTSRTTTITTTKTSSTSTVTSTTRTRTQTTRANLTGEAVTTITGSMSLQVADPDAFVADPDAKAGIEAALANISKVPAMYVNATLSVVPAGGGRRLAAGDLVKVMYTIVIPDSLAGQVSVSDVLDALGSVDEATMTSAISAALEEIAPGKYSVTVTALEKPMSDDDTTVSVKTSRKDTKKTGIIVGCVIGILGGCGCCCLVGLLGRKTYLSRQKNPLMGEREDVRVDIMPPQPVSPAVAAGGVAPAVMEDHPAMSPAPSEGEFRVPAEAAAVAQSPAAANVGPGSATDWRALV